MRIAESIKKGYYLNLSIYQYSKTGLKIPRNQTVRQMNNATKEANKSKKCLVKGGKKYPFQYLCHLYLCVREKVGELVHPYILGFKLVENMNI